MACGQVIGQAPLVREVAFKFLAVGGGQQSIGYNDFSNKTI